MDLIVQRSDDFTDTDTIYFAMQIIKDMEPTIEQYATMFKENACEMSHS